MADERAMGITHFNCVLGTGLATLIPSYPDVMKTELGLLAGVSGVLWMCGGTLAAGISAAHMIEVSNVPGLAYSVEGSPKIVLGATGGTLTVQVIQHLRQGFVGQY